jgi:hypothetical protein
MVVLDEHLQSKGVEQAIRQWYVGSVVGITDLRPQTIIKDDAIPALLSQQNIPVFVTINTTDFWQKILLTDKYCLVCLAITTAEIPLLPDLLRRLLRHPDFDTKAKRAGKAVRITAQGAAMVYSINQNQPTQIENW